MTNVKLKAFTLQELLVVLIIIGILTLLVLPNLLPLITKAKTTEAQLQLKHIYTLQKSYFYTYSRYSDDLLTIGFEQEKLVTQEGSANYIVEIVQANNNSFIARATSVTDFDGDGNFNVWEINHENTIKEIMPD